MSWRARGVVCYGVYIDDRDLIFGTEPWLTERANDVGADIIMFGVDESNEGVLVLEEFCVKTERGAEVDLAPPSREQWLELLDRLGLDHKKYGDPKLWVICEWS